MLYLSVNTRPDIAVSVSILCRKTSNPTAKDWTDIKRLLKYLRATCNNKLRQGKKGKVNSLIGYADADADLLYCNMAVQILCIVASRQMLL